MRLDEFLLARIAEDEADAQPLTVAESDEDGVQPRWQWALVDWNNTAADA